MSEFRYKKCYVSEDVPGSPQPPPQNQKGGFSLEVCLKSRVALFASGCLRDWFWRPKLLQNGRPNRPKGDQKHTSQIGPKIERKSVPKWSQNDSKMEPKWYQNLNLKFNDIFNDFWVPRGAPRIILFGTAANRAAPIESIYDSEPFIFYVRFSHDVPTTPYGCAAGSTTPAATTGRARPKQQKS